jgi:hypothetical protein
MQSLSSKSQSLTGMRMTKNKVTAILSVLILLTACQKGKELPTQPAPPPQAQKQTTAMAVAKVLKDAGIPFLSEHKGVTFPIDSSPGTPGSLLKVNNDAGILSSAVTATTNADADITVFSSREKREQARKRVEEMQQKLGDTSYFAEAGCCISVNLREDDGKPNKTVGLHTEAIQKVLKEKYGD